MASHIALTVIVPIGPGDSAWQGLLPALASLPSSVELIFVATASQTRAEAQMIADRGLSERIGWHVSEAGRGLQLNFGAALAKNPYVWFLHADSRIRYRNWAGLAESLSEHPDALYYCNLKFYDGPLLTAFNAWGAWFRSHVLHLPFGDQGFCISRELFDELGGFRTDVPYGEDHLLVWQALQRGIQVRCSGEVIATSARKYQSRGWMQTTLLHNYLTLRQALPEFKRLCQFRLGTSK